MTFEAQITLKQVEKIRYMIGKPVILTINYVAKFFELVIRKLTRLINLALGLQFTKGPFGRFIQKVFDLTTEEKICSFTEVTQFKNNFMSSLRV